MHLRGLKYPGIFLLGIVWAALLWADDQPATEPTAARRADGVLIHNIDAIDPEAWKFIPVKQQLANVAALKEFATAAGAASHERLRLVETPHFLIYTAYLTATDAAKDAVYLEYGYTVASHIFGLRIPMSSTDKSQGMNLWRGKAVYFIFDNGHAKNAKDFAQKLHPVKLPPDEINRPDQGLWALATLNGNGSVDVVATTNDIYTDQRQLVRAMTAAFIYRLHSPTDIAPWVEEGLAYGVAGSISNNTDSNYTKNRQDGLDRDARNALAQHDLDYWLNSSDINDPINSPAGLYDDFTLFMYKQSTPRFLAFVIGMKDGLTWQKSMETKYGIAPDRLESTYTATLKTSRR